MAESRQRVVGERRRLGDPVEIQGESCGRRAEREIHLAREDQHGARVAQTGRVGNRERDPVAGVAAESGGRSSDRERAALDAANRSSGWTWLSWRKSIVQVYAEAGSVPSSGSLASPLNEMTSPPRNTAPSLGARIVAVGGPPFATLTGTGAESVELPAASRARAVNACAPFATVRVSQANAYGGAESSSPALTPSTRNCTPATPTLSLASCGDVHDGAHLRVARRRADRNARRCGVTGASGDRGVHVGLDLGRCQCPVVDADVVDAAVEVEGVPVGRWPMLTLAVEFCCVAVTVPTSMPSSSWPFRYTCNSTSPRCRPR